MEGSRGKVGGEGGALWGLGKTAILLQKCGFTRVLGTLVKLGFCRPCNRRHSYENVTFLRLQALKPRKTHDPEGLRRRSAARAAHLVGAR